MSEKSWTRKLRRFATILAASLLVALVASCATPAPIPCQTITPQLEKVWYLEQGTLIADDDLAELMIYIKELEHCTRP